MKKKLIATTLFVFTAFTNFFLNYDLVLSNECITQEQLQVEILKERTKWDINSDNKYGIEEVIYALQLISGFNNIDGLHFTWNGKNTIYYDIYMDDIVLFSNQRINKDETKIYDLSPGNYIIIMPKSYGTLENRTFQVSISPKYGKMIRPSVGYLEFTWNGYRMTYGIYQGETLIKNVTTDQNEITIHDLAPGEYKIILPATYGDLEDRTIYKTVTKDSKVSLIPSSYLEFTWDGENSISYQIFAGDNLILDKNSDYWNRGIINKNETKTHYLSPGEYKIVLYDTYGTIEERTFYKTIVNNSKTTLNPSVGYLEFTWNGYRMTYGIYQGETLIKNVTTDQNEITIHDLAPGEYKIILPATYGDLEDRTIYKTVTKDSKVSLIPSSYLEFTWDGENSISYQIFAGDNLILDKNSDYWNRGIINKNETKTHYLSPGNYALVLDETYEGTLEDRTFHFTLIKDSKITIP